MLIIKHGFGEISLIITVWIACIPFPVCTRVKLIQAIHCYRRSIGPPIQRTGL